MNDESKPPFDARVVDASDDGMRLDRWLPRANPGLSRGGARRLLHAGKVRVNGHVQRTGAPVHAGDRIDLLDPACDVPVEPQPDLPLVVVHEDARLVVVDKPAGMHTHPQRPGERGTLVHALIARYPEMTAFGHSPLEPGIVHRLDRDTSGLVLAARDRDTFDALCLDLRRGGIVKRYQALCAGRIEAPLVLRAHLRAEGARVAVRAEAFERSRPVELTVESSEPAGVFSRVVIRLDSAARHQIRAQMAFASHPVVGDRIYGGPLLTGLDRHLLHAAEIDLGGDTVVRAYQDGFGSAWC